MDIYDPISEAFELPPHKFDAEFYSIPKDAEHTKWASGSTAGPNHPARGHGRPKGSFKDYVFVTDGTIEKIVHKDKIPSGMERGRLRDLKTKKKIFINDVEYESQKAAAESLGVSPAMITYMKRRSVGKKFKVGG